jgi:hypothetical protein
MFHYGKKMDSISASFEEIIMVILPHEGANNIAFACFRLLVWLSMKIIES